MVGEDEVDPAAVDVEDVERRIVAGKPAAERLQKLRHRHGRAFDMPAGTPRRDDSGRARPARLARLRRLPQHEIHRVALVGGDVDPRPGQHLVERAAGERAVARRARHRVHRRRREQHVVLGDISHAARDEALDHRPHRRDVVGGARLDRRRQAAERRDVILELAARRLGDLGDRFVKRQIGIVARRARVDLVLDVGDVAGVDHMARPIDLAQQPEEHVEHDHRPGVADMSEIVDGRPADIDPHGRGIDRLERLLAAGQGVVEAQRHRTSRLGARRRQAAPSGTGRMIASRKFFTERRRREPASL